MPALAQAGQHFRPDAPVVRLVGLDAGGVVLQVDREHGARYHPGAFGGDYFTLRRRRVKRLSQVYVYFSVKVWCSSHAGLV